MPPVRPTSPPLVGRGTGQASPRSAPSPCLTLWPGSPLAGATRTSLPSPLPRRSAWPAGSRRTRICGRSGVGGVRTEAEGLHARTGGSGDRWPDGHSGGCLPRHPETRPDPQGSGARRAWPGARPGGPTRMTCNGLSWLHHADKGRLDCLRCGWAQGGETSLEATLKGTRDQVLPGPLKGLVRYLLPHLGGAQLLGLAVLPSLYRGGRDGPVVFLVASPHGAVAGLRLPGTDDGAHPLSGALSTLLAALGVLHADPGGQVLPGQVAAMMRRAEAEAHPSFAGTATSLDGADDTPGSLGQVAGSEVEPPSSVPVERQHLVHRLGQEFVLGAARGTDSKRQANQCQLS